MGLKFMGYCMKDIDLVKQHWTKENLALCIVRNGEVLFSSHEKGILPLYQAVRKFPDKLIGASASDRVVGKGAALLFVHLEVAFLYAEVISHPAQAVLEAAGIKVEYGRLVPRIMNRNKNGLCPIETMAMDANGAEELIPRVESFLTEAGLIP